jgi:hypothetical protein
MIDNLLELAEVQDIDVVAQAKMETLLLLDRGRQRFLIGHGKDHLQLEYKSR